MTVRSQLRALDLLRPLGLPEPVTELPALGFLLSEGEMHGADVARFDFQEVIAVLCRDGRRQRLDGRGDVLAAELFQDSVFIHALHPSKITPQSKIIV